MTPIQSRFTRLVAAAALLLGAGCEESENKIPGDSKANPVAPIFLFLDVRASRTTVTANEEERPVVITVEARFADTGAPVADGTRVSLSASLGGFDTPGGPASIELELFDGLATINYYPGSAAGTARIRASLQGVLDQVLITIKPDPDAGPPPEPAPVASTITLQASPTFASESEASTDIDLLAIVRNSEGNPHRGGPVNFTTEAGVLASGGAILSSDSNGEVFDILTVTGEELEAIAGSSFTVTATLGLVGGATTSSSFEITILRADDPPTPTSIVLNAAPTTVPDNGADQVVTLTAVVRDQNGAVMAGVDVQFNPELGTPSSTNATTDAFGVASITLTLDDLEIAAFPSNFFDVEAIMGVTGGTASDTVTLTISRPSLAALFAVSGNPDTLGSMIVNFTDQSTGGPTSWAWDLDGDGFTDDANIPNPSFDYTGHIPCDLINVTLVVSNLTQTDSATMQLQVQPCP